MTAPPPRRPWWKSKRTWAALLLWLLATYAAGLGPTVYAVNRGWLPRESYPAFRPLWATVGPAPPLYHGLRRYQLWWADAAVRHRGWQAGHTVIFLSGGSAASD